MSQARRLPAMPVRKLQSMSIHPHGQVKRLPWRYSCSPPLLERFLMRSLPQSWPLLSMTQCDRNLAPGDRQVRALGRDHRSPMISERRSPHSARRRFVISGLLGHCVFSSGRRRDRTPDRWCVIAHDPVQRVRSRPLWAGQRHFYVRAVGSCPPRTCLSWDTVGTLEKAPDLG